MTITELEQRMLGKFGSLGEKIRGEIKDCIDRLKEEYSVTRLKKEAIKRYHKHMSGEIGAKEELENIVREIEKQ